MLITSPIALAGGQGSLWEPVRKLPVARPNTRRFNGRHHDHHHHHYPQSLGQADRPLAPHLLRPPRRRHLDDRCGRRATRGSALASLGARGAHRGTPESRRKPTRRRGGRAVASNQTTALPPGALGAVTGQRTRGEEAPSPETRGARPDSPSRRGSPPSRGGANDAPRRHLLPKQRLSASVERRRVALPCIHVNALLRAGDPRGARQGLDVRDTARAPDPRFGKE